MTPSTRPLVSCILHAIALSACAGLFACDAQQQQLPDREATCTPPSTLAVTPQVLSTTMRTTVPGTVGVTLVKDLDENVLASFTMGARTVVIQGPERTFTESTTASKLITKDWVRVLPAPFSGTVDESWLDKELTDTSDDALAISTQYMLCAPPVKNAMGLQIEGTSHYGPQESTGDRLTGADFNDYLGISWTFPSGIVDPPRPTDALSMDCSGFMRMIWGYRLGVPMDINPSPNSIPRRSFEILDSAPGVVIIPNNGSQVVDFSSLLAGDLVFFDADNSDGPRIDHVGMFMGKDETSHYRFASSRKSVDGPTLGDYDGPSILDGGDLFARSFRGTRRL